MGKPAVGKEQAKIGCIYVSAGRVFAFILRGVPILSLARKKGGTHKSLRGRELWSGRKAAQEVCLRVFDEIAGGGPPTLPELVQMAHILVGGRKSPSVYRETESFHALDRSRSRSSGPQPSLACRF